MNRWDRLGWWAFGIILGANVLSATLRPADAQTPSEDLQKRRGRCVGVAASVAKDGSPLVYRAFEDGTVEERRAESIRDGKITYVWKPALRPAD